MIRKLTIAVFLTMLAVYVHSQIYDPVTWSFDYEKKDGESYELIFTALIEKGSHIYSMDVPEGGPIPTTFTFDTLPDYILEGNVVEVTAPEELFDEAFGFRIK